MPHIFLFFLFIHLFSSQVSNIHRGYNTFDLALTQGFTVAQPTK
jgi:hypothetical protein